MQPSKINRPLLTAALVGLAALGGQPITDPNERRFLVRPTRRPCKAVERDPQYRTKRKKANKAARKARIRNKGR